MKKAVLALALMLCGIMVRAQVIANLDEIALLGNWSAVQCAGVWENLNYRYPVSIQFNDNAKSYIYTQRSTETDPTIIQTFGYWIGGTSTGRYTLHFLKNRDYADYTGVSLINFVITNFTGDTLTLSTYDGLGEMIFVKDGAGIADVKADTQNAANGTYTISGIKVDNTAAPGVYVVGGEKVLVK